MGVWIETPFRLLAYHRIASHPVWVCGLKLAAGINPILAMGVTPCMGVWIETVAALRQAYAAQVTPCMGVWIETAAVSLDFGLRESHPVWVCGLKQWLISDHFNNRRHTLYGCVD